MATAPRLAPGSLLTVEDQERAYREAMGADAAAWQVRARALELGKCVCTPRKVSKRWPGDDAKRTRTVHERDCPRFASWMVV